MNKLTHNTILPHSKSTYPINSRTLMYSPIIHKKQYALSNLNKQLSMGSAKQLWKLSFNKSPKQPQTQQQQQSPTIPVEFLCPISGSIMADPVIISSGHTFERNCILACISLSFNPTLPEGVVTDFSTVIPNLALKSTILNWCIHNLIDPPKPLDLNSAHNIVQHLMPPPLTLRDHIEISSPDFYEEEEKLIARLKSSELYEQEEALVSLRKLTRTREEMRASLCTPRLLLSLKPLISSRYSVLQVNAVAVMVNLSLEKKNKVKIVRSGVVPSLIEVLRSGLSESQEHAAGALFSLSVDDQNKTALGVLGALPPLLHALRSGSNDSALALYHLSLVQSNRVKMIKLGSVQILLGMVKAGHMPSRVMLVLCNLAASVEGRAAMLDGGAVECLVGLLSREDFDAVVTRERCLAALYGLSYGGLRFKGLAKEAGAEEVLMKVEETGSEREKEKARRILEVLRAKEEVEHEDIDWEELLNSEDDVSRTHDRLDNQI